MALIPFVESSKAEVAQKFGPVVKVDQLVKEMIKNDETKELFA